MNLEFGILVAVIIDLILTAFHYGTTYQSVKDIRNDLKAIKVEVDKKVDKQYCDLMHRSEI